MLRLLTMAAMLASRAWAVQMLLVALSRRICIDYVSARGTVARVGTAYMLLSCL